MIEPAPPSIPPDTRQRRESDWPVDDQLVIKRHSKSFSLAAKLLPARIRQDVRTLYAWCRWCDDAVDEAIDRDEARSRLALLESDLDRIARGVEVVYPASAWLAGLVKQYHIPLELPRDLLAGMKSDIEFERVRNTVDLDRYAYRVAGTVGRMMSCVMGVTSPWAQDRAESLGIAMQLTNIARDVDEDWDRGRCYLPADWFPTGQVPEEKPSDQVLAPLVCRLLKRAEHFYRRGAEGYVALPRDSRLAIEVAAEVYRAIGEEIGKSDCQVIGVRHATSIWKKMAIVARLVVQRKIQPSLERMTQQHQFNAVFGLSLTLVMATVLFVLVGLNPKQETYDSMPWLYAVISAVTAASLGGWARRLGIQLDRQQADR